MQAGHKLWVLILITTTATLLSGCMSENEKFIQGSWFYFDTRGSLLNYDNVKIPITIDRQNDTISPYGGGSFIRSTP
jgi:hypothetical protein